MREHTHGSPHYNPRCPLMLEFRLFSSGDRWGDTMGALFDVAAELYFRCEGPPDEWRYRPGAACNGDPRERDSIWFDVLEDASTEALDQFGRILWRYRGVLEAAGESY